MTRRLIDKLVALLLLTTAPVVASERANWTGAHWLREGNRLLAQEEPAAALDAYDQAASIMPDSAEAQYNRGVALYHLQRYGDAETALQNALRPTAPELEAAIKYNLGRCAHAAATNQPENAEQVMEGLQRAIDFYEDALLVNPSDADARANLQRAQRQQLFVQRIAEQLQEQNHQQQSQPEGGDQDQQKDEQQNQQQSGGEQQDGQQQESDQQQSGSQQQGESQQQQQSSSANDANSDPSDASQKQNKSSQDQSGQSGGSDEIDMDALQKELERELERLEEELKKREEQGAEGEQSNDNDNGDSDKPDDARELSQEQLEELKKRMEDALQNVKEKKAAAEKDQQSDSAAENESTEGDEQPEQEPTEDEQALATSQPADGEPSETAAEQVERISRERALRLLQEARDKEAARRKARVQARRNLQGSRAVEKDW